jgi:hypothetical protein
MRKPLLIGAALLALGTAALVAVPVRDAVAADPWTG